MLVFIVFKLQMYAVCMSFKAAFRKVLVCRYLWPTIFLGFFLSFLIQNTDLGCRRKELDRTLPHVRYSVVRQLKNECPKFGGCSPETGGAKTAYFLEGFMTTLRLKNEYHRNEITSDRWLKRCLIIEFPIYSQTLMNFGLQMAESRLLRNFDPPFKVFVFSSLTRICHRLYLHSLIAFLNYIIILHTSL